MFFSLYFNVKIIVKGQVNYEESHIFRLMVSARDYGPDPTSSDTMVIVRVSDANDNAPEITVNTLVASDTEVASVPENVPPDTFVAYVLVKDPDSGVKGRFNCELDDKYFRLKVVIQFI